MSNLVYALEDAAQPGVYGAAGTEGPGVTISEHRPESMLQLGAWPDTQASFEALLASTLNLSVPSRPGLASVSSEGSLLVIAPGRYLLVSDKPGITQQLSGQIDADQGVVTDLSHARAGIRMTGRNAADVLRKGFAIDLDIRKFPVHSVAQTTFHHIGLTLHRTDETTFELFIFRGFALSFWEALTDAALEYGYQVAGAGQ
ncbi:sarcosine oxidase subunit gamma [Pelagibius sp. Alg239-R121]|uniref:sarcosine oxidase subunit gamma n=1 Tax=Pelagibius sp. Alg239-R121 TaxID=2993448 RepID=UPI0024A79FF0|nr:sarcosine oxidase subunit gamma family protein [Pelagibius sp. Alg239-R121]